MSGSFGSGVNFGQLFGVSNMSGALLNAVYGVGAAPGGSPADAFRALQTAQRNQTQDISVEAKQPQVASDIAAFKAALAKATTPAQLLQNPVVLKVLLTINGLSSQIPYPALARKALLSNPSDTNSLANQLKATNANWLSAASTYQFATKGLSVLRKASTQTTLVNAYAEVSWRQSLDATTPGLSNALSFLQTASTYKSAAQILGNPPIALVIMTALNIPKEIAFQSINAQEKAITDQLDISRLQNPKYVQNLAQEYLLNTATAAQASGSTPDLSALAVQAAGLVV